MNFNFDIFDNNMNLTIPLIMILAAIMLSFKLIVVLAQIGLVIGAIILIKNIVFPNLDIKEKFPSVFEQSENK